MVSAALTCTGPAVWMQVAGAAHFRLLQILHIRRYPGPERIGLFHNAAALQPRNAGRHRLNDREGAVCIKKSVISGNEDTGAAELIRDDMHAHQFVCNGDILSYTVCNKMMSASYPNDPSDYIVKWVPIE